MSSLYRTYDPNRKPGKPQNDKQQRASKENFMLFQLKGAEGNLNKLRLPNYKLDQPEHEIARNLIADAVALILAAQYWIKRAQKKRKENK